MPLWVWVALGSAVGGVARFAISRLLPTVPGGWPLATMLVNVVGSFIIGWLAALLTARTAAGGTAAQGVEALRLFWMTGVLGGFTTYSAFALETVNLASTGEALRAVLYVLATVALCLLAAFAGRALGPG
ncbi:MAG: fluoride efflux transporter FluC [Steroidobacteraceae bacterium]|jgi:CrcB protein